MALTPALLHLHAKSGKADPGVPPLLELLSLYASWNSNHGDFAWEVSPDGVSASARLPFGTASLQVADEDQDGLLLRVSLSLSVEQSVRLHCLEVRYRTTFGEPDRIWVPHLKPGPDLIIADQIFRSPAIVLQKDARCLALIPDLSLWPQDIGTFLDFEKTGPDGGARLSHGVGHWKTTGHVFFKRHRAKTVTATGTQIRTAHFLMLCPDAGDLALDHVNAFLWRRFARTKGALPQVLPFDRYEKLAIDRIFAPDLFHRFEYQGRPVAGMITQTMTSRKKPGVMNARQTQSYLDNQARLIKGLRLIQSKVYTNRMGNRLLAAVLHSGRIRIVPMASFGAWFNQVRTALGAALHARRTGEGELEDKSRLIIELALSAPTEHGCFPSVCLFPEDRVSWVRGTRAFELIDSFHTPDAAITGFHLLQWHETIGPDPRILEKCADLARFFIRMQDPSGAIPAWVRPGPDGPAPEEDLVRSASTAAPAMLLARLHRIAPDPELLSATKAAIGFIEQEVLPRDKWFDYELFYSCAGRPTGRDGTDPYTGCFPANTLSMYWAARACLDIHLAEGDPATLELGQRILDRLSLFQQVFDHPRISIDTFGGFGVMNADAEFNDARQGLFVPLYLDYYRATGEADLFERAVAALRACFTTMLTEEHSSVAPGNLVRFRPSDRGSILENYAHTGRDEVTAGYLSPDWGCGTSLYASGLAFRGFGQVYVDVKRGLAFGIDRCTACFISQTKNAAAVEVEAPGIDRLEIVVEDPDRKIDTLIVNDRNADPIRDAPGRFVFTA